MGDVISIHGARRPALEPLWRDVLGRALRDLRHEHGERLVETAARAGISPQYLSEVERGRKDPSSEMLAAIAGALGTDLIDLTRRVAEELGAGRDRVLDLTRPEWERGSTGGTSIERAVVPPASAAPDGQPQLLALAA